MNLLLHPALHKLPHKRCCSHCSVWCICKILRRKRPSQEREISLWYTGLREVRWLVLEWRIDYVQGPVHQFVVRVTDLDRLVDVDHIDLVVPRPWAEFGRLGIFEHNTWTIFTERCGRRWNTWASLEPYRQRSVVGILAGLKEPEKHMCLIVAVLGRVRRQVDVAAVTLDTFGGLADACLGKSQPFPPFGNCTKLASLKEIETPGNLVDSTTVTPSGVGGNAAVTTGSAREHTAQRVCNAGMIAGRCL